MYNNQTKGNSNKSYYLGFSLDEDLRYKAASGGIGSAIIKTLLRNNTYGTSLTFEFNKEECKYEPKLIYNYSDYNNCGSVYQDTDTIGFIKKNINNINKGIVVTCMPCQVKAIRTLLTRENINHFIISLCCSGQTTVQGTWCYYKLLGIRKQDVVNLQYRGNGWPSGIQIQLNNGKVIKKDNYTYPWTLMHESLLFRPKRCLYCPIKTSNDADVSLADPWLKEYMGNDTVGHSVVICSDKGSELIVSMAENNLIKVKEVDERTYINSQLGTIETKAKSAKLKKFNHIVESMSKEDSLYKRIVTSSASLLLIHLKILRIIKHLCKN